MRALFIITSAKQRFWLSEVTHPYWHLAGRGVKVDFASPGGGEVRYNPWSDPDDAQSWEGDDLVSRGFLATPDLVGKLRTTTRLSDVDASRYDAVHVAGGAGAAVDLFPNEDVRRILIHVAEAGKPIATICHGSIALANIPDRIRGRRITGMTREEDAKLEEHFGRDFIPHWPQEVLEDAGAVFVKTGAFEVRVVVDGHFVTGQNNQSASEYAVQLLHAMVGDPVEAAAAAPATPIEGSAAPGLALWCFPRTSARASMIALEEAGLPYETRLFDIMADEQFTTAFLSVAPKGQIPVLLVDGVPLTESVAILSFLAAVDRTGRLAPREPLGLAQALSVVSWLASGSLSALLRIVRPYRISGDTGASDGMAAMARAAIRDDLVIAERHLAGRRWWLDRWSVADAYLYYLLGDARRFGVDLKGLVALAAFEARSDDRPAVRRVVAWEEDVLASGAASGASH